MTALQPLVYLYFGMTKMMNLEVEKETTAAAISTIFEARNAFIKALHILKFDRSYNQDVLQSEISICLQC